MTEADLNDLGVHRISVPVPFPQAGGTVNVYLLEEPGGGVMMFDSGLGSPEAEAALAEGFARAGHRFDEVRRIVLSHGHVDHYGAALSVIEKAGRRVPVYAHPADMPKVASWGRRWKDIFPDYGAYLLKLGVPSDALATIEREVGRGFQLARRIPEVEPVEPGEVLHLKYLAPEVLHMPGHTPGLVCLHDRRQRLLFSADHLLEKISPNPIIEIGPNGEQGHFKPLLAYLHSVRRIHALEIDLVLPGHGPPFGHHRPVIDALLQFYERRHSRIQEALERGPMTAYEVSRVLFPWAGHRDLFLVVSETIANLEVMESNGAVARDLDSDVFRFRLAS